MIALLFILPLAVIAAFVGSGSAALWQHLASTLLWEYVSNSLLLMLGVGAGVFILGVPTAWFTSMYRFPGHRLLAWALLLPLAFPAYIIAYTYTGMLDVSGPVQTTLREWTGWQYGDYWFFNIRSLGGAVVMLSLVLYPYVYLLVRTAFLEQSATIIDAGRSLGYSRWQSWLRLGLPMARPAVITGMSLALMETLADFGTVQYFGVNTFTTGIFRAFYGFGETAAAAQLSAVLLSFVVLLIAMERYCRRQVRYHQHKSRLPQTLLLSGWRAWAATLGCSLPLLLGFLIPAWQLLDWSLFDARVDKGFFALAWHSFYLAALAALLAVGLALLLAYAKRIHQHPLIKSAVLLAGTGYAVPGTIIALGVIIPLAWLDHQLIAWLAQHFTTDVGLLLSGSLTALLFAYSIRFLAVSLGTIDSGLHRIKPSLDSAARLLGYRPLQVLRLIHLPLLRGSVLTALLIVFVDVLKELPATLMLRPFNFNTLAVRAYELASDERLVDAAPAALCIVFVGLLPVMLLSRSMHSGRAFTTE
ncbi:MAG: iron ABC transporter permease [Cellvibrionaceae bacterium]|nr:iron ABC transporter permease [Cellvibrionaceae bacterium]